MSHQKKVIDAHACQLLISPSQIEKLRGPTGEGVTGPTGPQGPSGGLVTSQAYFTLSPSGCLTGLDVPELDLQVIGCSLMPSSTAGQIPVTLFPGIGVSNCTRPSTSWAYQAPSETGAGGLRFLGPTDFEGCYMIQISQSTQVNAPNGIFYGLGFFIQHSNGSQEFVNYNPISGSSEQLIQANVTGLACLRSGDLISPFIAFPDDTSEPDTLTFFYYSLKIVAFRLSDC